MSREDVARALCRWWDDAGDDPGHGDTFPCGHCKREADAVMPLLAAAREAGAAEVRHRVAALMGKQPTVTDTLGVFLSVADLDRALAATAPGDAETGHHGAGGAGVASGTSGPESGAQGGEGL